MVCTGQGETEDAKTNIQNPQFTISISELGKYTRNKRKYWLDDGEFGEVADIFWAFMSQLLYMHGLI